MPVRKVTKGQLDKLIKDIRTVPSEKVGDCLTDDEFIRYVREELSEDESKRIDQHLESCDECLTEAERLVEGSEAWRGEAGKQRLDALRKRCLDARASMI